MSARSIAWHSILGIETHSIDVMTGVPALEYIRHGALTLIVTFNLVAGQVSQRLGPTHAEEDFAHYLVALLAHRVPHEGCEQINFWSVVATRTGGP
jgi:hypothetical protein